MWPFSPALYTQGCFLLPLIRSPPPIHRDDSAEVDVYNPTKNEWDKIPSMNQVNMRLCRHW